MAYSDGTFTSVKQDGITRVTYPFLNAPTKDTTTKQYEADYVILPGSYTPAAALSTWPGDGGTVAADANAYLVEETPVQREAGAYRVTRRYSDIPGDQVYPSSKLFVRPVMHDITVSYSGTDYFGVTFDEGITSHVFSARKTVSSIGTITNPATTVAVAAESFGTLPSATFSINDGTSTVSPTLSSGAFSIQASIEAALGALTSVECSSTPDALTVSWTGRVEYVSTSATGVTMIGGAGTDTSVTFTANKPTVSDTQTLAQAALVRTLTSTAHGGSVGDFVAVWNGTKLVGTTKVIAVTTDTVTINADESPWAIGSLAATHMQFADTSSTRYVNGPKSCSTRSTMKFYLPGVSMGITTAADIPLATPETDPVSWLTAVVSKPTGWAVDGSTELAAWEGPILVQDVIELQMDDAIDTVSVSA